MFWYDPKGEWTTASDSFALDGVTKLTVCDNEFGTKVRILGNPDPQARFLVYIPAARPPDGDNWLLDLLLQGHEFKADGISLAMQEAGLPYEFRPLAEQHAEFFKNAKRVQALRELFAKDDGPAELRLKMMSVLAGTAVELDAVLLEFLKQGVNGGMFDPVVDLFGSHALVDPFWREVKRLFNYTSLTPSLRDFAVTLFRAANPLDPSGPLAAHARVFLQRWKDSQAHSPTFRAWSQNLERDFHLAAKLDALTERSVVGDTDTFEIFEKFSLHRLCKAFEAGAAADEIRKCIQSRRPSFWYVRSTGGSPPPPSAIGRRGTSCMRLPGASPSSLLVYRVNYITLGSYWMGVHPVGALYASACVRDITIDGE